MKILIVEDDIVSREILKAILQRYGTCDEAENGQIAVDKHIAALESGRPYDLICLDIMMPILDGQKALQEIRRVEGERGVGGSDLAKIVMTTALTDPQNVMQAFVKGACEAYLTKPISPKKIIQVLLDFGFKVENAEGSNGAA